MLEVLVHLCMDCDIANVIDKQLLACFPHSPKYVTYRARLEGTSETDSSSLISLIGEWVSGGASIIIAGVPMTVDFECSVAISSLSERECPTHDNTTSSCFNPGAIIAGVVVVILVIAITIVIIAVVILMIFKHRNRDLSTKK